MKLTQPKIEPVQESGKLYILLETYVIHHMLRTITIPKGFRSDGATKSRLLFQRDGMHRAAAWGHDYLYSVKGAVFDYTYTRLEADRLFRDMLIRYGVKSWHVKLAYAAVRIFGWYPWNKVKNSVD